jgi:nucleoside-diphosphate-sugar epimerase
MRVMVAGAAGAVGARLIPLLVSAGHEVTRLTRSPAKTGVIERAGARSAVADALGPAAVRAAVLDARPEVVVHEMTALSNVSDLTHFDRAFAVTNRLRTEGLDHLLDAAKEAGARRVVAQSFCGWPYARTGGPVKTEEDPSIQRRRANCTIRSTPSAILKVQLHGRQCSKDSSCATALFTDRDPGCSTGRSSISFGAGASR